MNINSKWCVLLNEYRDDNTRLIFKGREYGCLIDITVSSQNVEYIVETVVKSNWTDKKVMAFLNVESEKCNHMIS